MAGGEPSPDGQIAWLDTARALAVVAVVVVHAASSTVAFGPFGTAGWWAANLYDAVSRWCVPVFVMVSGALLLDPRKRERAGVFYRKRVARLLIPLVFWSVFFLAASAVRDLALGARPDLADLGRRLLSGRPHYHLWYLYMLVSLFAITPLIRWGMGRWSRVHVVVGTLGLLAASMGVSAAHFAGVVGAGPFPVWGLRYVPYYVLGYLIASSSDCHGRLLPLAGALALAALTAVGLYLLAEATDLGVGQYLYDYFSVTVVPMSLLAFVLLRSTPSHRLLDALGGSTLGIYLIHPLFLGPMNDLHMAAGYPAPLVAVPAMAAVAVALSAVATRGIAAVPYLRRIV